LRHHAQRGARLRDRFRQSRLGHRHDDDPTPPSRRGPIRFRSRTPARIWPLSPDGRFVVVCDGSSSDPISVIDVAAAFRAARSRSRTGATRWTSAATARFWSRPTTGIRFFDSRSTPTGTFPTRGEIVGQRHHERLLLAQLGNRHRAQRPMGTASGPSRARVDPGEHTQPGEPDRGSVHPRRHAILVA
jgi:hypothetical protein